VPDGCTVCEIFQSLWEGIETLINCCCKNQTWLTPSDRPTSLKNAKGHWVSIHLQLLAQKLLPSSHSNCDFPVSRYKSKRHLRYVYVFYGLSHLNNGILEDMLYAPTTSRRCHVAAQNGIISVKKGDIVSMIQKGQRKELVFYLLFSKHSGQSALTLPFAEPLEALQLLRSVAAGAFL
jgi:hypothetical protein